MVAWFIKGSNDVLVERREFVYQIKHETGKIETPVQNTCLRMHERAISIANSVT